MSIVGALDKEQVRSGWLLLGGLDGVGLVTRWRKIAAS